MNAMTEEEKVRNFSALMRTLSLDADGLLADSCWGGLDHLADDDLQALADYIMKRRESVKLADIFTPTVERAAMVRALCLVGERKRSRRREALADKAMRWRERNGSLAPIVSTPEGAITPETEEEADLDPRGKDALRKRKAYHAKREVGPRLAPIETRRLINKIKVQLLTLPHDSLVEINRQIEANSF
jgi:hypothetical protein